MVFVVIAGTIEMRDNPLDPASQQVGTTALGLDQATEPEAAGFFDTVKNWVKGVTHVVTMPVRWVQSAWKTVTFDHNFLKQGGYTYVRYLLFIPVGIGLAIAIVWLLSQVIRRA